MVRHSAGSDEQQVPRRADVLHLVVRADADRATARNDFAAAVATPLKMKSSSGAQMPWRVRRFRLGWNVPQFKVTAMQCDFPGRCKGVVLFASFLSTGVNELAVSCGTHPLHEIGLATHSKPSLFDESPL